MRPRRPRQRMPQRIRSDAWAPAHGIDDTQPKPQGRGPRCIGTTPVCGISTAIEQLKDPTDRFEFERGLLRRVTRIAGVDEAGRGPLAGPVVAAAVMLPTGFLRDGLSTDLEGLNDSKQLTARQRERYFEALSLTPGLASGVSAVGIEVIDAINILRATHQAMAEALAQLEPGPEHVLVDGLPVKSLPYPQTALVKGDARSYSIAAASILAKVTRDRLMLEYDRRYPEYGFARHKGYGTPQHLAALARHGPCPIHRRSFTPTRLSQPHLF